MVRDRGTHRIAYRAEPAYRALHYPSFLAPSSRMPTFIGVHNVCAVLLQAARTGRLTVNSSEVEDVAADLR
jgi:hypothetical protein